MFGKIYPAQSVPSPEIRVQDNAITIKSVQESGATTTSVPGGIRAESISIGGGGIRMKGVTFGNNTSKFNLNTGAIKTDAMPTRKISGGKSALEPLNINYGDVSNKDRVRIVFRLPGNKKLTIASPGITNMEVETPTSMSLDQKIAHIQQLLTAQTEKSDPRFKQDLKRVLAALEKRKTQS